MADRAACAVFWAIVLTSTAWAAGETLTSRPADRTVEGAYPDLASGALRQARLKPLSRGVLLKCGDIKIAREDLSKQLKLARPELSKQLEKHAFYLLEQVATPRLLLKAARKKTPESQPSEAPQDDEQLIIRYLDRVTEKVKVSDAEVKKFYESNKDMCGGATLDQIKDQLLQYVLEQKRQEAVEAHLRTLGNRLPIEVDAGWTQQQAKLAMDNPVDKARASGKPTMVDFGAIGCRACDMMTPILKSLEKKYKGKANVLFVHVREEQILASRYGIRSIPIQVFFDKDGKEVFRHSGFYPQAEIEKHLAKLKAK